jgi:hypothetical protein
MVIESAFLVSHGVDGGIVGHAGDGDAWIEGLQAEMAKNWQQQLREGQVVMKMGTQRQQQ